jgi:D-galactose 1-dehydrogenase
VDQGEARSGGPFPVAVVGVGKIARDQHLPAIAGDPDFRLVAAVSRHGRVDGVQNFPDMDTFLREGPQAAVALCAPPGPRTRMAMQAIAAGRDVLLEKPPAATLGEIEMIVGAARERGVTLFATWHSRFAPVVAGAREWLAGKEVRSVRITWKEDVRRWHPGQEWIWEPGGFGVFDPGINALSILTEILPGPFLLDAARLDVPENRAMPIAAELTMTGPGGVPTRAVFDWRQEGPQTWDIKVETGGGTIELRHGGAAMRIDGGEETREADREYAGIYRRFAALLREGRSDVDVQPLRLVADAFLLGRRETVEAFHDPQG